MIIYECDKCKKQQKAELPRYTICKYEPQDGAYIYVQAQRVGVSRGRSHDFNLCPKCVDEIYDFIDSGGTVTEGGSEESDVDIARQEVDFLLRLRDPKL